MFLLEQICRVIHTEVPEGKGKVEIKGFSSLQFAEEGDISFFADIRYKDQFYATKASAVIVPKNFSLEKDFSAVLIPVDDPKMAITRLLHAHQQQSQEVREEIESPSFIHASASIGKGVYVGAFSYIKEKTVIENGVQIHPQVFIGKNVHIGEHSTILPGAKIFDNTIIGKRVLIGPGAVIGSKGFGYAKQEDGSYTEIPQIGKVILEDDVHIGANTAVDRAAMGKTIIKQGTKLDNLIQIGHNVEVGKDTIICALSGVGGSSKIGNNVVLTGKVGVADHISVPDGTLALAMSGIFKSFEKTNMILHGLPADEHINWKKQMVLSRKLPQLVKRLDDLERKLNQT